MSRIIRKKAYWIFDDDYVAPTFLSVFSFLQWCDIPVVLLYYGKDYSSVQQWFYLLMKERQVSLVHVNDTFFSLPIFDFNKAFSSSIRNRELRFYVASLSGPNDIAFCFDSDLVFNERCKKLLDLDWDGKPSVFGCKEREHTFENVLFFERGLIHSIDDHIYPEFAKDYYDTIFGEDTACWLEHPQFNNGLLVFCNVTELADAWRCTHEKGLSYPFVNPGEDQVTLIAAISHLSHIDVKYLTSTYNSMGQLNGLYGVFHATGCQWKGEIVNALHTEAWMTKALSDCSKTYKDTIIRANCSYRLINQFLQKDLPYLYHSIPGFFYFVPTYRYIYSQLPKDAAFVEIGTYKGKSICFMAESERLFKKNVSLYSIDNYSNVGFSEEITYSMAKENLEERDVAQYVNLIEQDSVISASLFADSSLDCVFIDGDIRYEGVWLDLNNWYRKIRKGGIIAGNNYTRIKTVREAVDNFGRANNINWLLYEQCYLYVKQ